MSVVDEKKKKAANILRARPWLSEPNKSLPPIHARKREGASHFRGEQLGKSTQEKKADRKARKEQLGCTHRIVQVESRKQGASSTPSFIMHSLMKPR